MFWPSASLFLCVVAHCDKQLHTPGLVSLAHSIFNPAMEKDLANHLAKLADQYHELSLDKAKLAYEFAVQHKLKIPDSWILDKKVGRGW